VNGVAAVIPAYNAAASVGDVVRRTRAVLDVVVVVDDGSGDGTAEVAREAGGEVLTHAVNRGKGAALVTAFRALFDRGYTAVVTLDADGQHLPEEIPRLLETARASGADLVLGTRDHLFAEMGPVRRLSNRLSSWAISGAAGRPLSDVQTGFRLYTRRLVEATGLPETRFDAESAVVVRAARAGFVIATVAVRLGFADGRTTSHYRPILDSLRIARAVLRARLDTPRRPVRASGEARA
jgi:glycosyltransferase involved in cell wall biosynthesis